LLTGSCAFGIENPDGSNTTTKRVKKINHLNRENSLKSGAKKRAKQEATGLRTIKKFN